MNPGSEDDLWRSIVDNYGDRPDLVEDDPVDDDPVDDDPVDDDPVEPGAPVERPVTSARNDEERFVPPPPPPLPRPDNKRLVAWIGIFGVPAILLVCLVFGIGLPALASYALVAWFVGGFSYLVLLMPKGPRDPDDNGARV